MSEAKVRVRIRGEKRTISKLADQVAMRLPSGPRGGRSYQLHEMDDGVTAGLYVTVAESELAGLFAAGVIADQAAVLPPSQTAIADDDTSLIEIDQGQFSYPPKQQPPRRRFRISIR